MDISNEGRRKPFISETARELLREMHGGRAVCKDEPAIDELLALGLAKWATLPAAYVASDTRDAERAYTQRMAQEIRSALHRIESMHAFADDLRGIEGGAGDGGVQVIEDTREVTVALGRVAGSAKFSVLTAHPKIRKQDTLDRALPTDLAMLARGVTFRTIYLDNARSRVPEQGYAAAMTAAGAEVRTALPGFERMIIADERIAFLADHLGDPERVPALMVTHPSLVKLFVNVFWQQWDRAEPWTGEPRLADSITTPRSRRMLRRLSEGKNIKAIAAELDVSVSTLYADRNALHAATDTTTEFQLAIWWATSEQARREREKDR
ncbi:helix-turn-helix domain-containing protein [Streptomyces sp. NBC_01298]|uniref:helix-turn-helix domain-containing protein n=1 Tax=Streptomyces sp. NBC_01298 TaxID=2903817 RepID=UPI002E1125A7|nr:helix-turn-helix domain-containing protein [Streptomyces sp. NBC_01298]